MSRVLLVETKPSKNTYNSLNFDYDRKTLTSNAQLKKVLKKDVELQKEVADEYDWVILVGSEPFKFFTGKSSVTEYAGKIVDEKFIPTINPAMLAFKPEAKKLWENSVSAINDYVTGKRVRKSYDKSNFKGIDNKQEALEYIEYVRQ